jgi:hypothetical protein
MKSNLVHLLLHHARVRRSIVAGFRVRWFVPRTGFDESEMDSEMARDSIKIAADSRILCLGSSHVR